jgi:hypothetical protein
MFRIPNTPVHLPSNQDVATLEAGVLRRESAITDEMLAKLLVPEHYGKKLKELWDESVRLPHKERSVELYCHTSRHGEVLLVCDISGNIANPKLVVLPLRDDEDAPSDSDETGVFELAASDAGRWTEEERDFLRGVWTAFNPVGPMKAEKQVAPNAPCPCGKMNGTRPVKYKRCCGV